MIDGVGNNSYVIFLDSVYFCDTVDISLLYIRGLFTNTG